MIPLALWSAAALAAPPDLADHRGEHLGSHLVWTSRYEGVTPGRMDLAVPLPGAEVLEVHGGTALFDDGALVGLQVAECCIAGWAVQVPLVDGRGDTLGVPLVGGGVPQRVETSGLRFSPADDLELQAHIGHVRGPGVTQAMRRTLDRRFDGLLGVETGDTLYVLGSGQVARRGLAGHVVPLSAPKWRAVLAGILAFCGAILGLLTGARWLDRAVKRERREAYLRDELGVE